jgi:hypothetical protein
VSIVAAQYFGGGIKNDGAPGPDAIHITKVQSITLTDGQYTSHRRVSPVPQLSLVGGDAQRSGYRPRVVQCVNKGSDGNTINWKCEADMDEKYQFGRLNVQCEGYRYSGDEWVLKGSCGLEYELNYTPKAHRRDRQRYNQVPTYTHTGDDSSGSPFFLTIIVLVIIIVVVYKCCLSGGATNEPTYTQTTSTQRPSGMYPNASAPPYNPDYVDDRPKTYTTTHTTHQDNQPGFWTGAAVGGAMGYGLGRATAPTHTQTHYEHQPSYRTSHSTRYDNDDDDSTSRTTTGFATTSSR